MALIDQDRKFETLRPVCNLNESSRLVTCLVGASPLDIESIRTYVCLEVTYQVLIVHQFPCTNYRGRSTIDANIAEEILGRP